MNLIESQASPEPAQPGARRTKKFHARRQAILASATEAMNRKGVRGMTLAEVAGKLGLVPTGVIYYFPNKEALAAACFMKAIEVYDALIAEAAEERTPQARLGRLLRGHFRFRREVALGLAEPVAAFNDVRALDDPTVNAAFIDMFRRARGLLTPDDGAERTTLNAETHLVLSLLFWAGVWLHHYDPEDFERAAERSLDILLHGLGAPGAVWSPPTLPPAPRDTGAAGEMSRETFLRAATELINAQGYMGASVEKISARLKVTKGSFYHHNDAKDDLVVACFERTLDIMRHAQRAACEQFDDGWTRLSAATTVLVEHQVSGNAPLLRISALSATPEAMQTQLIRRFDHVSVYFAGMISDGIADGSLRPVDATIAAHMIHGAVNAAAELSRWAPGVTAETAADLYVRPLLTGMLSGMD
ncbi:MAG: TetR family transcriptional regulator [Caulobacteraceae bacterium]|nr:TetR family transcriptional regulator [Caulobacteraceae bacterium]